MDPPSEASGEVSGASSAYLEENERGNTELKRTIMHTKDGNEITFPVDQWAFSSKKEMIVLAEANAGKLIIREQSAPVVLVLVPDADGHYGSLT
ncbi:MAG: hypothetical protein ASARMPRED_005334 [Alectoria sarmentosa]|nr:MAG: hypothetical protein ASARMPRED_005334 [Alectoria sarmentosa]